MNAADVCKALGGHQSGNGYVAPCPAHDDTTPSLSIADGDKGLVWHCHAGCEQDAVRAALAARGLLNNHTELEAFHIRGIGAPSQVWTYRDAKGLELGVVCRYDTANGKTIRPWRRDRGKWIAKAMPEPRPLYGLPLLVQRPDAPVLIVEGEKCADAANDIIGTKFVAITWPGGAKAIGKADLSPLRGRNVTIWPDADKPGRSAAKALVVRLRSIAASVSVLDVDDRSEGWDVADAVAEKWTADALQTYIEERARAVEMRIGATDDAYLLRNDRGAIRSCEHNARVLIDGAQEYAGLHFDDFLSRMRIDGRDWLDADDLELVCGLQSKHDVAGFTLGHARHAAQAVAYTRRRDSLRELVEGLPAWDGTPRIELAFVDAWGAPDSPLIRAASTNFFVALIARALQPGAQVDTVWAFEGAQGTFKSRSMRALGGPFHAEISAAIGTTDFMREMRGLWIAELSELDSLRGREASTVKKLLSAPTDRYVEKYQIHAESYPRRAVAVATTNEASYWQDPTGARRLVPIPCGEIRIDIVNTNRLQWFAEARRLHAEGSTWWEFPAGIVAAQEERQQVDPWEDVLQDCIAHGRRGGLDGQGVTPWSAEPITSAAIMAEWLRLDPHQQGKASGVRLAHVMRRLGFVPMRIGHTQARGWRRADTQPDGRGEVSA